MFKANIAFDDHPNELRFSDQIYTVTVESIVDFVKRQDPKSRYPPARTASHAHIRDDIASPDAARERSVGILRGGRHDSPVVGCLDRRPPPGKRRPMGTGIGRMV